MVHFGVVILTPFKTFSTMNLESDYYSSTCEDINGLSVSKRPLFGPTLSMEGRDT